MANLNKEFVICLTCCNPEDQGCIIVVAGRLCCRLTEELPHYRNSDGELSYRLQRMCMLDIREKQFSDFRQLKALLEGLFRDFACGEMWPPLTIEWSDVVVVDSTGRATQVLPESCWTVRSVEVHIGDDEVNGSGMWTRAKNAAEKPDIPRQELPASGAPANTGRRGIGGLLSAAGALLGGAIGIGAAAAGAFGSLLIGLGTKTTAGSEPPPSACPPCEDDACERVFEFDMDADDRSNVPDFGFATTDFTAAVQAEIHPVRTSQVQFRAVAPAVLEKGRFFPLKIMMYEEDYRAMAEEIARKVAPEVREEETGFFEVAARSRVRIRLSSKDIDVAGEEDEVTWLGKLATFSFQLELPEDYAKKQLRLEGRVYVNSLALTSIKLMLDVQADRPQVVQIVKEPYRSAFISYASKDREEVMKRVQGMHALSPEMDIFTDVEKLRTGEMWEQRIFDEIHKRDILYLCWSRNAAESTWVNKEWRYAYAQKGQMGIEPLPIEPPELAPPPEALQCRHFGDWTLRYMRFKNEQK